MMFLPFKSQVYWRLLERTFLADDLRSAFQFYLDGNGRSVDLDAMRRNRLAQNRLLQRLCERGRHPVRRYDRCARGACRRGRERVFSGRVAPERSRAGRRCRDARRVPEPTPDACREMNGALPGLAHCAIALRRLGGVVASEFEEARTASSRVLMTRQQPAVLPHDRRAARDLVRLLPTRQAALESISARGRAEDHVKFLTPGNG